VALHVATVNKAINAVASVSPICNLIATLPRAASLRRGVPAAVVPQNDTPFAAASLTGQASWADALRVPYFSASALFYNILNMSGILGPSCIPDPPPRFFSLK